MTTTINASPSNGLVQSADGSGILKVQSNGVTTNALAWGSYGFVGGSSAPSLRSAYNITSITQTATGTYDFAFTAAVTDGNYAVIANPTYTSDLYSYNTNPISKTTTGFTLKIGYTSSTSAGTDTLYSWGVDFVVFGN